jgi:hypothetical protein
MANLPAICVVRKILSSEYQPFACGKIFRVPLPYHFDPDSEPDSHSDLDKAWPAACFVPWLHAIFLLPHQTVLDF